MIIQWYISQSYISSLDLDLDKGAVKKTNSHFFVAVGAIFFHRPLSRSTSASHDTRPCLQMLCTCITRHILQSHNGLEHIFVPCWTGGNWGFHCLKTLKFQKFSGRCPEPRWGAHSAPHTPSWFCLVPPGHLNPGSATEERDLFNDILLLQIEQKTSRQWSSKVHRWADTAKSQRPLTYPT